MGAGVTTSAGANPISGSTIAPTVNFGATVFGQQGNAASPALPASNTLLYIVGAIVVLAFGWLWFKNK